MKDFQDTQCTQYMLESQGKPEDRKCRAGNQTALNCSWASNNSTFKPLCNLLTQICHKIQNRKTLFYWTQCDIRILNVKCAEHCNCTIGHWTYPWEAQFTQNLLNTITNFLYSQFIRMQYIKNSHRCLDHQAPTASCLDLGAGKGGPCGNLLTSDHNANQMEMKSSVQFI